MIKPGICHTMECDTYYQHHHEKNRNKYLEHIKNFKVIKVEVLSLAS